jgi:hypothetical protein
MCSTHRRHAPTRATDPTGLAGQAGRAARSLTSIEGATALRVSLHLALILAYFGALSALTPSYAEGETAAGAPPKITFVSVRPDTEDRPGLYHFRVKILHDDTGWENYVEAWEIIGPEGEVLGERPFFEPKPEKTEQLTALSGVPIPTEIESVKIRARHYPDGYPGEEVLVELPR